MKIEYIVGKSVTLIITPENEIDKAALMDISKADIEAIMIRQNTQLLDRTVTEGIIIQQKNKEVC